MCFLLAMGCWGFMHCFSEMGLSIGVFYGWGMEWKMRMVTYVLL